MWRLLAIVLLAFPAMADTLTEAQVRFDALQSYQLTLRSSDAAGEQQVIHYFFLKPGWVRMDFVKPHRGAVLVYSPATRRVRLWPFGLDRWPSLDIAPTNSLLRNPHGHRVDRSDVGVLLAEIVALREGGQVSPLDDAEVSGRPAIGLDITGPADGAARRVQRYKLWLARDTLFPLRVDSFAADGSLIESVDMSDAQLDVRFPPRFFTP